MPRASAAQLWLSQPPSSIAQKTLRNGVLCSIASFTNWCLLRHGHTDSQYPRLIPLYFPDKECPPPQDQKTPGASSKTALLLIHLAELSLQATASALPLTPSSQPSSLPQICLRVGVASGLSSLHRGLLACLCTSPTTSKHVLVTGGNKGPRTVYPGSPSGFKSPETSKGPCPLHPPFRSCAIDWDTL